jgi:hypothetical protein
MGEKQNQPFQLSFNSSLKVGFQGSRVTSDGGLLLVRELDERLGLRELIREHLTDGRDPRRCERAASSNSAARFPAFSGSLSRRVFSFSRRCFSSPCTLERYCTPAVRTADRMHPSD